MAIAAAVVGPPIFAFDARIASSKVKPNIFAAINVTSILINTIIPQNRSNKGDFSIIASIEAGIPITTKKMYIKNVPISFAPLNELKYFGNIDANPTVNVVTSKYLFEINVIKDESPKLPIYLERVKLIATITTAVAKVNAISVTPTVAFEELLCSLISTNKNIKLTQDIEDNIKVFGNEILIMRMIDNLLSNALKYAKSEVNIVLAKKNSIILEIADDGIGISDEEKVNIWNRFYKVDKSRTTTEDNSSGLGLSITKKIIDLHNWKIGVLDNNPNGAKFVVNL